LVKDWPEDSRLQDVIAKAISRGIAVANHQGMVSAIDSIPPLIAEYLDNVFSYFIIGSVKTSPKSALSIEFRRRYWLASLTESDRGIIEGAELSKRLVKSSFADRKDLRKLISNASMLVRTPFDLQRVAHYRNDNAVLYQSRCAVPVGLHIGGVDDLVKYLAESWPCAVDRGAADIVALALLVAHPFVDGNGRTSRFIVAAAAESRYAFLASAPFTFFLHQAQRTKLRKIDILSKEEKYQALVDTSFRLFEKFMIRLENVNQRKSNAMEKSTAAELVKLLEGFL
jgi:hypothetical protein